MKFSDLRKFIIIIILFIVVDKTFRVNRFLCKKPLQLKLCAVKAFKK